MEIKSASEIVEENFKGLDELIDDKELLNFYKSLIATCMNGFGEELLDNLINQSQEMLYERNANHKEVGLVKRDFQVCYAVPKQTIVKLKELIK